VVSDTGSAGVSYRTEPRFEAKVKGEWSNTSEWLADKRRTWVPNGDIVEVDPSSYLMIDGWIRTPQTQKHAAYWMPIKKDLGNG